MNNPREQISVALFNLLKNNATLSGLVPNISRAAKIWSDVPPSDQPALFLIRLGEDATQAHMGLTKYKLHYRVLVYIRSDTDPTTTIETQMNAVMDAIDAALQYGPKGEAQTLGGLVTNTWIEGETLIDTGILDQQCAILIPVSVLSGI